MNVFVESQNRIEKIFKEFDNIYVSFSGGKDSGVLLNLCIDYIRKNNLKRKIGVFHIDYEAQYTMTTEYVDETLSQNTDILEVYRCCVPFKVTTCTSMHQSYWRPWEEAKKDIWVSDLPKNCYTAKDFDFYEKSMWDYEFSEMFTSWLHDKKQAKKTCCLVGIRTDESLNRFRTIASKSKVTHKGKQYTTEITQNVFNVYPIYDWATRDIWIYHYKNPDKRYNQLYELMHKAGLSIHQQRICQPYGDDQRRGLWLFHLIEPETWAKVVARVNGANSGALYVNESGSITGYNKIKKPDGHTWESFAMLFLNSIPESTKEHYLNKIYTFCKWWEERGYPSGIPDEAPYILESKKIVPSWRRICKSLLRNDYWCKGLGFTQHKTAAYKKYLELKKRKREEDKFLIEK